MKRTLEKYLEPIKNITERAGRIAGKYIMPLAVAGTIGVSAIMPRTSYAVEPPAGIEWKEYKIPGDYSTLDDARI